MGNAGDFIALHNPHERIPVFRRKAGPTVRKPDAGNDLHVKHQPGKLTVPEIIFRHQVPVQPDGDLFYKRLEYHCLFNCAFNRWC
jgi:hypothetical protein